MHPIKSLNPVLGGTLLIAATTVGVGMLALPVSTGIGGFFPAITIYCICWLFMLCTGFLLLEVCLWLPKEANLISMAHRLLGPIGQSICWILYLFLFTTVMIAHISGGAEVFQIVFGIKQSAPAAILYMLIFSPIVYLGTNAVNKLNSLLFVGVLCTYILFILFSYDHINLNLLSHTNWPKSVLALPLLFTAFTYQVIIPTLTTYLRRDVKKIRQAILLGTGIPLIIYLVWEFLILSIVPVNDLINAQQLGQNAIEPLRQATGHSALYQIGKAFAFFVLTTSYITLSLAFLDFLADGLKTSKKGISKLLLCLFIFIPPTCVAATYPNLFLLALNYAGGYSCAILFGLFPPLMVWVGRYRLSYLENQKKQLFGNKPMLAFLVFFIMIELIIEFLGDTLGKTL